MENRVGTDLIEVARVKESIERTGQAFLERVYTPLEQAYCDTKGAHRFESYAARFAAKEAFSKAVGTGIGAEISFHEVEIINEPNGRPMLRLHGGSRAYFEKHFSGCKVEVSLSHTAFLASAVVFITA